ncbi:MAG: nitroreductase family protein, partial [Pseudomonadota bacterium]|nr:nitroreductase family protein [Pseudomonadota bacterium]
MALDQQVCDELLNTTRSVRKRLDLTRPVAREVIDECLQLAVQAPTGSNVQGWRWIVIDDSDTRAALAALYRRSAEGYLSAASEQASSGTNAQTQRVFSSAMYLMEHLHEVPVHLIPCIQGNPPNGLAGAGFYASIYPAVWS